MSHTEPVVDPELPAPRSAWWAVLRPAPLITKLIAGVVLGSLMVTFSISMATLVYGAAVPDHLDRAIGLGMLSSLSVGLLLMVFGSKPGVVAHLQDAPAAILATMAGSVAASFAVKGLPGADEAARLAPHDNLALFMTIVAVVGLTTLASAIALLLVGQFRLGRLVRYLPYPVIGGFMAGTGWLLLTGSLTVLIGAGTGTGLLATLLRADTLGAWLPGLGFAVLLLYVSRNVRHFLVWPVAIVGVFCLFYLVVLFSGSGLSAWRDAGYLLGPFPEADLLQGIAASEMSLVDWSLAFAQLPTVLTVAGLSLLAALLNSTAIELQSEGRIDLDKELRAAGLGNLLAGAIGGQVGYPSVSMTALNAKAGGGGRVPLGVALLFLAATLLFGASLLEYVPTVLVGGLLAYLGINFLYQWLVEAYGQLTFLEYGVVVFILVVIALAGFLPGVSLGLVLTVALFVVNYSRVDAVRHALTGAELSSRMRRDPVQQRALEATGAEDLILQLQGYLFFGSTNAVLERIEKRVTQGHLGSVILDFRRVTGVDANATAALRRLLSSPAGANYRLYLTDLAPKVLSDLKRRGLAVELAEQATIFATLDEALETSETRRLLRSAPPLATAPAPNLASTSAAQAGAKRDLDALHAALGDDVDVTVLERFVVRHELAEGACLITQGDPSTAVYFVASGRLSASLKSREGTSTRLESMRYGSVVGEVAFLTGEPRSASVNADEPAVVYELTEESLARLTEVEPATAAALNAALARLSAQRIRHLMTAVEALQR